MKTKLYGSLSLLLRYARTVSMYTIPLALVFIIFSGTRWIFERDEFFSHLGSLMLFRAILIGLLIVMSSYAFYRNVVLDNQLSERIKNIFLAVFSVFVFFLLFELFFCFFAKSHSFFLPHASKLWLFRYNKPTNARGFRDQDIAIDSLKKTIVFIGDSFTAGNGIPDPGDRYSDIIRRRLPDNNVLNCGVSGSNTINEIRVLRELPVKPDILVWQYFFNDMEGVRPEISLLRPLTPYSDLGPVGLWLVKSSLLLNYVYWRLPHDYLTVYIRQLENDIQDNWVRQRHFQDLEFIKQYCQENKIRLVVVVFPLFIFPESHLFNRHSQQVVRYFLQDNIPVVDVSRLVKGRDVAEIVVNDTDPHANEAVNRMVADHLLPLLANTAGEFDGADGE